MLTRLLKILNLLHRRRVVGREELSLACELNPETIDRYVSHLKEAGIPIVFDHAADCYRLRDDQARTDDDRMSPFDVFVLRLALRLLKARLNGLYKPTVENIEARLEGWSAQAVPERAEHLLDSIERRSDTSQLLRDLNCCLILEAMRLGREIQVVEADSAGLPRATVVTRASLEFGDEWILRDLSGAVDRQIPISAVTDIRLV